MNKLSQREEEDEAGAAGRHVMAWAALASSFSTPLGSSLRAPRYTKGKAQPNLFLLLLPKTCTAVFCLWQSSIQFQHIICTDYPGPNGFLFACMIIYQQNFVISLWDIINFHVEHYSTHLSTNIHLNDVRQYDLYVMRVCHATILF